MLRKIEHTGRREETYCVYIPTESWSRAPRARLLDSGSGFPSSGHSLNKALLHIYCKLAIVINQAYLLLHI